MSSCGRSGVWVFISRDACSTHVAPSLCMGVGGGKQPIVSIPLYRDGGLACCSPQCKDLLRVRVASYGRLLREASDADKKRPKGLSEPAAPSYGKQEWAGAFFKSQISLSKFQIPLQLAEIRSQYSGFRNQLFRLI